MLTIQELETMEDWQRAAGRVVGAGSLMNLVFEGTPRPDEGSALTYRGMLTPVRAYRPMSDPLGCVL